MKKTPPSWLLLLGVGMIASASVSKAATIYFQNEASTADGGALGGTYAGTLADIGFDASLWNRNGTVNSDEGGVATRPDVAGPGLAYDINLIASNLDAYIPAGMQLESVTILLYTTVVAPDGETLGFSVYDGYQAALGNFIGTLEVNSITDEYQFISITVTGEQFEGGISITSDGLATSAQLNVASEMSTVSGGIYTPSISLTFVPIPEPGTITLAVIGSLAFLRRRRA
ncbi:PEP-CTERM sorting domain-containing protein [Luteolibacter pohnpeiensis]|uniref:PEP-CTERM sorting domain-containing protein n=1 Tax=Luteolibacter pohnpeiensis TaxID=454153 RepID=A0A934SAR4_9BACT|nr:PEP-CTERM sorting domain-containing protein [Luteolibacter pohnpeiensis]MBK1884041.1 PEP-CTERM sorting domain-containing protein [Luteolibacter pohnpeiensis]